MVPPVAAATFAAFLAALPNNRYDGPALAALLAHNDALNAIPALPVVVRTLTRTQKIFKDIGKPTGFRNGISSLVTIGVRTWIEIPKLKLLSGFLGLASLQVAKNKILPQETIAFIDTKAQFALELGDKILTQNEINLRATGVVIGRVAALTAVPFFGLITGATNTFVDNAANTTGSVTDNLVDQAAHLTSKTSNNALNSFGNASVELANNVTVKILEVAQEITDNIQNTISGVYPQTISNVGQNSINRSSSPKIGLYEELLNGGTFLSNKVYQTFVDLTSFNPENATKGDISLKMHCFDEIPDGLFFCPASSMDEQIHAHTQTLLSNSSNITQPIQQKIQALFGDFDYQAWQDWIQSSEVKTVVATATTVAAAVFVGWKAYQFIQNAKKVEVVAAGVITPESPKALDIQAELNLLKGDLIIPAKDVILPALPSAVSDEKNNRNLCLNLATDPVAFADHIS
ncbi:MAG: hypothetical protein H0X29_03015 [Parachlamydiaceae bacterium]|nr:hypothetical protein [Parachlamydiaceae bacterium]